MVMMMMLMVVMMMMMMGGGDKDEDHDVIARSSSGVPQASDSNKDEQTAQQFEYDDKGNSEIRDADDNNENTLMRIIGASSTWYGDSMQRKINREWNTGVKWAYEKLKRYGRDVQYHVHEMYSPPRNNDVVKAMQMIPGMSLDLTCNDPDDNQPWDFNNQDKAYES